MILATKQDVHILVDLAFLHQEQWSGGKSRSVKLYETLADAGFTLTEMVEPVRDSKWKMLLWSLQAILKFGIFKPFCVASLRTSGYNYYRYHYFVRQYPQVNRFLIEGTGFGTVQVAAYLKSIHKKVYFVPCNIESLAPYPDAWTHQIEAIDRLKVELKYYQLANACFCISLEEVWLLNTLGAKAFFLPHTPPKQLMEKIQIRKQQRNSIAQKEGYLYFANFFNSPNFLGFQNFIAEQKYIGKKIKVAGLGIEKILPLVKDIAAFEVLGTISDEELEQQLVHCEKVILHHYPTSGILTRVPELLLSGIPIEGNVDALKEYLFVSTTNEQDLFQHLINISTEAEHQFIKTISN